MQANAQEAQDMGLSASLANIINHIDQAIVSIQGAADLTDDSNWAEKLADSNWYNYSKGIAANAIGTADLVYDTTKAVREATKGVTGTISKGKAALSALKKTTSALKEVSKVGIALLVLDIAIQIGMFIATGDFSPAAIAGLLAGILLSVMLFVISLNPIGAIIVAIVGIVDLILMLVGLGDYAISGYVSKFMALSFYSSAALTRLKSDSIKFVDRQTGLADENLGYVVGNRFEVSDQFKAVIELARSDWSDDFGFTRLKQEVAHWGGLSTKYLAKSWVCAEFIVQGWASMNASTTTCPSPLMGYDPDNPPSKKSVGFQNTLTAEILLDTSGPNLPLSINTRVTARTYNLNGGIVNLFKSGNIMSYDPFTLKLPDDMEDKDKKNWKPQTIYLDVFPATLDEFWTWSSTENGTILTNLDPDSDGMTTKDEINARLGSNAFALLKDDLGSILADIGQAIVIAVAG
ncbi:MAG: hypothetical protein P8183_17710 [Anaerolineae bacterium]